MNWIFHYQLFLFDLDGLLVDTEELHWKAYVKMCHDRGHELRWDFPTYFSIAQQDAHAPERAIYAEFPQLHKEEPRWSVLYAEKKAALQYLLDTEDIPLLPGVTELLQALERAGTKRCVVTHSSKDLVEKIRKRMPSSIQFPTGLQKMIMKSQNLPLMGT